MQKLLLKSFLFFLVLLVINAAAFGQKKKKSKNVVSPPITKSKTKPRFKKYNAVITSGAKTDDGLFKVHQVKDKYYYEIPFDLLGKDMLLVTRISQIPAGLGGGYMNAGSKTNEQLIRWNRVDGKIHLRSISVNSIANDSLPINISVKANNYQPILAAFTIETFNQDSSSAVIEVSKLFLTDVRAISGLSERMRKAYKVRSLDKSRSFISRMSSFPENIEVRHDMTYTATSPPSNFRSGTISMQLSQSMYLLPEEPMMPRMFNKRVGWFTLSKIDYGSEALKADRKVYIRRWKLEPSDKAAYARGELVEPVKPIVFYLDPATPSRWKPFIKQGIEDWQVAFETAGFKNAIQALDPPSKEEDPEWSPEDARYSTIRYVATTTRNAMGPSVIDPRSGEIIESDIVWYHNHLRSYRNRYLLETGAANPLARTLDTPAAEIGEMIRMVIAHEVGHALGLPHNMKASYAYPTDSLRSATFTQKWGLASTLMDYTRYNYVAQPEDKGVRWVRMLGPYDHYSINWGYRYISNMQKPEDEVATLNAWIDEKGDDPVYLFGAGNSYDPSSQTECVGDDPVKASTYGLSNLKIVAANLADWTTKEGEGYDDLEELYGELLGVWSRYCGHVVTNIGGIYEKLKTSDQEGITYKHLEKSEQQKALKFLTDQVFSSPDWLMQNDILKNIQPFGTVERVSSMQSRQLRRLLRSDRLTRMIENESINGNDAYAMMDMLRELRTGIWKELNNRASINTFRRNIQRTHVAQLIILLNLGSDIRTDINAAARAELKIIQRNARQASLGYRNGLSKYHLQDIDALIEKTFKNLN